MLNGFGDVRVSFEEAKVTHTSLFSSVRQTMVYKVVFMTRAQNLKNEIRLDEIMIHNLVIQDEGLRSE